MTRKLGVLGALLLAMALSMGAQTASPQPITAYCVLTATGYCPNTTGAVAIKQGIDTHNVYIVPEGTPGTITVLIQGSVIGDFTDAATCGTSTTTTPNLLSCSGIYAAIRVRVSVMTVFTSVKLFYVGTSTVGKSGPSGGAVASVTGAGTVSCSPTTGAVVCTGSGSGGSPGGSSGDFQINNGSSGFAAGALNDNGTTITATETITPAVSAAVALGSSSLPWGTMYSTGKVNYGNAFDHVTTTNTSANVATNDLYYYCDATGAPVIMTLPAAMGSGRHIGVMKLDSTTNACSLARSGSDDIDGATAAQATSLVGQLPRM